jgi:HD-GYP domain-containing protein (c-di-GMP phosphodiesterase class II)
MTWVSEALVEASEPILEKVSALVAEALPRGSAVSAEEVAQQARVTLGLLIEIVEGDPTDSLFEYWEEVGRSCSERKLAMSEMPNAPDLLKSGIWTELEGQVEGGAMPLSDLVDVMMGIESILGKCSLAMFKSYLGSREIKVAERTERMDALYSLNRVLSDDFDSDRMYHSLAEKLASITGISRCSILLFGDEGRVTPAASNFAGALEVLKDLSLEELGALAAIAALGGPVVLRNGEKKPPEIGSLLRRYGTPLMLVVPLRSTGKQVGVALLDEGRDGEFPREQVELAVAVANQVAIAIDKSSLIEEMETRLKHMAAIGVIARTLTSFLDSKEQLRSLLGMACALVSAGAGAILLLEAMFDELKVEVSEGADGWPEDTGFLKAARWSCDNGRPLLLSRGSRERRFKVASGISGGMVAPLLIRDKAIGVIAIAAKPGSEYDRDDLELFANFAAQAAVSIENTQLYERLQDMYLGAIGSLAAAIEARDPYTVGHSARVTQYAVAIAEGMGLTQPEIEELRLAGLLHDLGKIGVPDSILNKPGRLSEEEFSAIKMHPALSMRIIEPLPHLGNIIPIIYHHHEHFDGSGYMDGKSGEKIPLGARIITVADSFEAMTSDRPYRKALSRHEAMMELKRCSGSQFDPRVVSVFVDLLEKTADEGS